MLLLETSPDMGLYRSWVSFWVGGGEFPLNLKSEESIRVRRAYPAHTEERDRERETDWVLFPFPRWGNGALFFKVFCVIWKHFPLLLLSFVLGIICHPLS